MTSRCSRTSMWSGGWESRVVRRLERGDTVGFGGAHALLALGNTRRAERTACRTGTSTVGTTSPWMPGRPVENLSEQGAAASSFSIRAKPSELRAAMAAEGLEELRFAFDHDGSTVLART